VKERKNSLNVQVVASAFPVSKEEFASSIILSEVLALQEVGVHSHVTTCRYGRDANLEGILVHRIRRSRFAAPLCISRLLGTPERLVFPKPVLLWPLTYYCLSIYRDKIIEEARMHNVDLIHTHFAYPDGYAATLAKKVVKKPLVISLRGYDILTVPSIKYGVRLKKHLENLVRTAIISADKVMVASKAEYNEALGIGADVEKLVVIPNGVDTKKFNPNVNGEVVRRRFGIEGNLVVLFVGSLLPVKGVEYLLRSMPIILSTISNVVFVIVGEGFQHDWLKNLSRKLGVSKNVIFAGQIQRLMMPYFFAACDVFVMPSLSEGFCNAVIEAMASGKPVVGTSVGGTRDQIRDGLNGYLVEPKNPRELAGRVLLLLSDPKKRKVMGRESREIAEREFSMRLRVTRTLEVYGSII